MSIALLVAVSLVQAVPLDPASVRCDLQGLYDEASQVFVSAQSCDDIDRLHAVIDAPDWVFVDATGHRHAWSETRDQSFRRPFESLTQRIERLSLTPSGAVVDVRVSTSTTILDIDGRYGAIDAQHAVSETTLVRDTWTRTAAGWKRNMREELGPRQTIVDGKLVRVDGPRR